MKPKVSIICLCYNHAPYIVECIDSVLKQTYDNIEVIIVDDASSDGSKAVIKQLTEKNPGFIFVDIEKNVGNCKAFNLGLAKVKGEFIIDLATDDVLVETRVARQVEYFNQLSTDYGVVYTDASYIAADGSHLYYHAENLKRKGLINGMPEGDIYTDVLKRFFISPPTMMIRKRVLEDFGGYDESLAYEDFDFWVRSARKYKYAYINERLTKVRKVRTSKSSGWYKKGDKQLHSTWVVCKKAFELCRTKEEKKALITRVRYEFRQAVFTENMEEATLFYRLLTDLKGVNILSRILFSLGRMKLPMATWREKYLNLRYNYR